MPQKFSKNDPDEDKFIAVWDAMLAQTFTDLNAYLGNVEQSPALGNALWEASAVDVWDILEQSFFVKIFDELVKAGYNAGAIDTYCRVIYKLFGDSTVIDVSIISPMEINIGIVAEYSNFTNWITKAGNVMLARDGSRIVFQTLLTDIPRSQLSAILRAITNAGTKVNFNLN
jgi:hypothetical protein